MEVELAADDMTLLGGTDASRSQWLVVRERGGERESESGRN